MGHLQFKWGLGNRKERKASKENYLRKGVARNKLHLAMLLVLSPPASAPAALLELVSIYDGAWNGKRGYFSP